MKTNDWKERLGVIYSTNPDFRYETGEAVETATVAKAQQRLRIALDRRHRGGKTVTLISGFSGTDADLMALGKMLRIKCGAGGAAKEGNIIVQGDFRQKVLDILLNEGYSGSRII
ncbi:MAG: translation initiation factor [Tannerella sp.]|jgi:translation initiation factor 1|nr:translation initiation factor [Tannerella sp.]